MIRIERINSALILILILIPRGFYYIKINYYID
jgi:hypothetical protein